MLFADQDEAALRALLATVADEASAIGRQVVALPEGEYAGLPAAQRIGDRPIATVAEIAAWLIERSRATAEQAAAHGEPPGEVG